MSCGRRRRAPASATPGWYEGDGTARNSSLPRSSLRIAKGWKRARTLDNSSQGRLPGREAPPLTLRSWVRPPRSSQSHTTSCEGRPPTPNFSMVLTQCRRPSGPASDEPADTSSAERPAESDGSTGHPRLFAPPGSWRNLGAPGASDERTDSSGTARSPGQVNRVHGHRCSRSRPTRSVGLRQGRPDRNLDRAP